MSWRLPEVMRELGVDLRAILDDTGLDADLFSNPDNPIAYRDLGRVLTACEQRSGRDDISLLACQRSRLADFGIVGRVALCGATVGDGLSEFVRHHNLLSSATLVALLVSGPYARFTYAMFEPSMPDTACFQLGAMANLHNVVRQLCGPNWSPIAVTFARRRPSNLLSCQRFFRAPLRFDSSESAVIFSSDWLDRPLPPVDPIFRPQVVAEVRARQAEVVEDLPATVRRQLRKQLLMAADFTMVDVAATLGMHRRTLDRHLKRHGILYRELLESVRWEVACELLRDTGLQIQRIAEAVRYGSAANFATAFRRWMAMTPSEYRRRTAAAA